MSALQHCAVGVGRLRLCERAIWNYWRRSTPASFCPARGSRWTSPAPRVLEPLQPMAVEDTRDPSQVDSVTAQTVERSGYRSFLAVPLCLEERTIGVELPVAATAPLPEREKRMAAAIGELVTAAVERIRFREASERAQPGGTSRDCQRGAVSGAPRTGDPDAVAQAVEPYGVALSMLAYSNATEDAPRPRFRRWRCGCTARGRTRARCRWQRRA